MPRKAKTLSGAPAQAPAAPRGGPYGEGEAALESQRRAPLPAGPAAPAPQGAAAGAANPMEAALQAAQQMAPPTSALSSPTARPDEPLNARIRGGRKTPMPMVNEGLYELRALAQRFPYPDLIALLGRIEREQN